MQMLTVKELRQITGLSQAKFAKLYHLSTQQVQTWEQGRRNIPECYLYILNRLVRIDFNIIDNLEV